MKQYFFAILLLAGLGTYNVVICADEFSKRREPMNAEIRDVLGLYDPAQFSLIALSHDVVKILKRNGVRCIMYNDLDQATKNVLLRYRGVLSAIEKLIKR